MVEQQQQQHHMLIKIISYSHILIVRSVSSRAAVLSHSAITSWSYVIRVRIIANTLVQYRLRTYSMQNDEHEYHTVVYIYHILIIYIFLRASNFPFLLSLFLRRPSLSLPCSPPLKEGHCLRHLRPDNSRRNRTSAMS